MAGNSQSKGAARWIAAVAVAVSLFGSQAALAVLLDSSGLGTCPGQSPAASFTCKDVKVVDANVGGTGNSYKFTAMCTQTTFSVSSQNCNDVKKKTMDFDVTVNAAWDAGDKRTQEKIVAKEKGGSRTDTVETQLVCTQDPWLTQSNKNCQTKAHNSTTKYKFSSQELPLSRSVISPADAKALQEGSGKKSQFAGRFEELKISPQAAAAYVKRPFGIGIGSGGGTDPGPGPGPDPDPTGPTVLTITQPTEGQSFALGSQIYINVSATGAKPQNIKVSWQKTGSGGNWNAWDNKVDAGLKLIPWNQLPKQVTDPDLLAATPQPKYRFRVQVEGSTTWTEWRTYQIKPQGATSGVAPGGTSGPANTPAEHMQRPSDSFRPSPARPNRLER